MEQFFRVAIHYDNDCGYIEYDQHARKIRVVLDNLPKKGEVEKFLNRQQVIRVAKHNLLDLEESKVFPADSLEGLKVVLTSLWVNTGVYVDWSRPVEM